MASIMSYIYLRRPQNISGCAPASLIENAVKRKVLTYGFPL